MRKILLGLVLLAPLAGCAELSAIQNSTLSMNTVYVAANAFDAVEITAANYLGLPACTPGGNVVCRNASAVKAIVPAVRTGIAARKELVADCQASTTASACVSAYTTVTTAITSLQNLFTQYNIQKGS